MLWFKLFHCSLWDGLALVDLSARWFEVSRIFWEGAVAMAE